MKLRKGTPDETGNIYGRLTVLEPVYKKDVLNWKCLCTCGNISVCTGSRLRNRHQVSCGCSRLDKVKEMTAKRTKPGGAASKEGRLLRMMILRCYDTEDIGYPYYGAKGVKICDRWLDEHNGIQNFVDDMGRAPKGLWIERKDSNGDYCPENCVWETVSNQQFNREKFSNNKSGVTGVTATSWGTWFASIQCKKIRHNKYFDNFEEAVAWRKDREVELFGDVKPEHREEACTK